MYFMLYINILLLVNIKTFYSIIIYVLCNVYKREKSKKDALCFNINADNKCQIKKKKKKENTRLVFFLWVLSSS